jgi:polar amino acid transport system substrate-binding protein
LLFCRKKFTLGLPAPVLALRTILLATSLFLCAIKALAQTPSQPPPGVNVERVLVIGTKDAPPFAMKDDRGDWTGLSIDLWKHIAEQLHLSYRFKETTLQGLIDETAAGELDGAVTALTVTAMREEVVDFTQPFYATGLGIAVAKDSIFDWWRLLRSLISPGFWVALLGLLGITVLIGVIVWLLERRANEVFGRDPKAGIARGVWWSASTMAQASTEPKPATVGGRIVALLWMGASVITIAVFTAGITSQLTAKQLQGTIHSFRDLKSVRVGAVAASATLPYLDTHKVAYSVYASVRDGLDAVKAGRIDALDHDHPILAWLAKTEFGSGIEVLESVFDKQNYAIALPNGSPLRAKINLALVPATQSVWWEELNEKYFGKTD